MRCAFPPYGLPWKVPEDLEDSCPSCPGTGWKACATKTLFMIYTMIVMSGRGFNPPLRVILIDYLIRSFYFKANLVLWVSQRLRCNYLGTENNFCRHHFKDSDK